MTLTKGSTRFSPPSCQTKRQMTINCHTVWTAHHRYEHSIPPHTTTLSFCFVMTAQFLPILLLKGLQLEISTMQSSGTKHTFLIKLFLINLHGPSFNKLNSLNLTCSRRNAPSVGTIDKKKANAAHRHQTKQR